MKKIKKILLAVMITVPLLGLADDPCQSLTNSDEKAACNDIYNGIGGVKQAKTDFINKYQYTPPSPPAPPSLKTSPPVFNIPPPNSPGTISTVSTSPITGSVANSTTSNQTAPNIYR